MQNDDNLKYRALDYARHSERQNISLPKCIHGEVRRQAIALGDYWKYLADTNNVSHQMHLALWPELAALSAKRHRQDEDTDDETDDETGDRLSSSTDSTTTLGSNGIEDNTGTGDTAPTASATDPENRLRWVDDAAIGEQLQIAKTLDSREGDALIAWLMKLKNNATKSLPYATPDQAEKLLTLVNDYPNLAQAGRIVAGAVRLQAEKKLPVKLPRLILQGEPGCGKTEFVRALAMILELPLISITLSAVNGEFELPGGHRSYRSSMPGRLLQGALKSPVANPIFLFDEAERGGAIAQHALLSWLEDEHFRDQYLELDFRVSQVNSILITNSLVTLDSAIQSRCRLIEVATLSNAEKRVIIQQIYASLLTRAEFSDFNALLDTGLVETLLSQPLRTVRVALESALYNAALHERRTVIESDFQRSDAAKNGFGFIRS